MKMKGDKTMRKGSIRIRTAAGVKYSSPLRDKADYEKVIKFLIAERDALLKSEGKQQKKSKLAEDFNAGFEAARLKS